MLIKAGRITNLTDARYFAAMEVDFIGFNLEEGSESYLEPMYMHAIREWIAGPRIVGEFWNSSPAYIQEAAAFFQLDLVQAPASPEIAALAGGLDVLAWLPATLGAAFLRAQMETWQRQDQMFILDFSGQSLPADTALWAALCADYQCLLHLDAPPNQWSHFLDALNPAGFSLAGGEEERVGIKSFDDLDEIFDVLGR
jgi:phosphoribosylanthranilate isomerase